MLKYSSYTDIRHTSNHAVRTADMCTLCGRPITGMGIVEEINGRQYVFDRKECALTFKKLKSVYGDEFCINVTSC